MSNFVTALSKPQGSIARWLDIIAVSIAGFGSFTSFYLIEFRLCRAYNCENLVVTSYFAAASAWYLLLGFALFGVALFLHRVRDLPWIFALAVTLSSLTGFILSGMVVFAMLKEAKSLV